MMGVDVTEQSLESVALYWEDLIRKSPNHVLGFTNASFGSDAFLPIEAGDLTDEEYASLIRLYRERGYFYSGEHYQESSYPVCPVMDNYRFVNFSRRGFGALIAHAKGDFSQMGYCHYTEAIFVEDEDLRYPENGLLNDRENGPREIEIDDEINGVLRNNDGFFGGKRLFVPITAKAGYYWPGDRITLRYGEDSYDLEVEGIVCFKDHQEYLKFLDYRDVEFLNEPPCLGEPLLMLGKPDEIASVEPDELAYVLTRFAMDETGRVVAYHLLYGDQLAYDKVKGQWQRVAPDPRFCSTDEVYFQRDPKTTCVEIEQEDVLNLCDGKLPFDLMADLVRKHFSKDEQE